MTKCTNCAGLVNKLELFPNNLCLNCWADTPEGRYLPTAEELVKMWGG